MSSVDMRHSPDQEEKIKANEENMEFDNQNDFGAEFSLFECCKQFKEPEQLFDHIKRHHDKDATKCTLCGKELSSKSSLDRHLLIHAKYQPYRCQYCNKQFSTNGNMNRHKKTHKQFAVSDDSQGSNGSFPLNNLKSLNEANSSKLDTSERFKKFEAECSSKFKKKGKGLHNNKKRNSDPDDISVNEPEAKIKKLAMPAQKTVNSALNVETYPPSPISQPDNSPNKEEFVANLGLRSACKQPRHIEKESQSGWCNISQSMNDNNSSETSLVLADFENSKKAGKELSDFADIQSILSNVIPQSQIESPESAFNKNMEISDEKACSPTDSHWLPESPEISSDDSNVVRPQINISKITKKHHSKVKSSYKKMLKKKKAGNKPKCFKCNICDKYFRSRKNAVRHTMNVHKTQHSASSCISYKVENEANSPSKISCTWCKETFSSNLKLEHHKRSATKGEGCPAKPFYCNKCPNRTFSTKNNGNRHLLKFHQGEQACILYNDMCKKIDYSEALATAENSAKIAESEAEVCSLNESVETSQNITSQEQTPKSDTEPSEPMNKSVGTSSAKEMDIAHFLLNMSTTILSPTSASIQTSPIYLKSTCSTDPNPIRTMSHSPMLSGTNVQCNPLDFSVSPIDLSSSTRGFLPPAPSPTLQSLVRNSLHSATKDARGGYAPVKTDNYAFPEVPLDLVKRKTHPSDSPSIHTSLLINNPITPIRPISTNPYTIEVEVNNSRQTLQLDSKITSVQCEICSLTFANNSNKRRHEKNKHQMHGQESEMAEKVMSSTPKTVLSKKTKEALITKVCNSKTDTTGQFIASRDSSSTQPLAIISNESENGDLASVSSLINTANSPQLKKYLTTDNACDMSTTLADGVLTENEEDDSDVPNTSEQTSKKKRGRDRHWCHHCEKEFPTRSSYCRHIVIHTKERNHSCPVCNKTFTVKSNRDRHIKNLHENKKSASSGKKQKSANSVLSQASPIRPIGKDSTPPEDATNISQCNKENQMLLIPS